MKAYLTIAIFYFLLACNSREDQCITPLRYSAYSISGKVSFDGYNQIYTRADIDWNADSTADVLLNFDTCQVIRSFSITSLMLNDTLWLTDTMAPRIAEIWTVDYDAVTPPFVSTYCADCYAWLGRVDERTYQLDLHLLMTTYDLQPDYNFNVVSDLTLAKN
jgi:hypothetical protein